jgi:hypothetical protein
MNHIVESKIWTVMGQQEADPKKFHVGVCMVLISIDGCCGIIEGAARGQRGGQFRRVWAQSWREEAAS